MKHNLIILKIAAIFLTCSFFISSAGAAEQKLFTGNDWLKLKPAQKIAEVKSYIGTLRTEGVVVKNDPAFYANRLDGVYKKHPNLKAQEVARTLKTVIIMEYDWEVKGMDKDAVAKLWLGEKLYEKNKARRAGQAARKAK